MGSLALLELFGKLVGCRLSVSKSPSLAKWFVNRRIVGVILVAFQEVFDVAHDQVQFLVILARQVIG